MLRVEETQAPVVFSPELISKFDEIVARYPQGKQKSALLPVFTPCTGRIWLVKPVIHGYSG